MQFVEALVYLEFSELCVEFSLIFFGIEVQNCVIKTREMLRFLLLINNSVTIRLSFLL